MTEGQIIYIAEEAHEVNRAYCELIGDKTQVEWNQAPQWQRISSINGVRLVLSNSNIKPSDNHENWKKQKEKDGWKYGREKDPEKKTHPCMVSFEELPEIQKTKDYLFVSIVRACQRMMK